MSLADTSDLHAGEGGVHVHDTFVWDRLDGTRVFVRVIKVSGGTAVLRCHHADRCWTRVQDLPLWPSFTRRPWTTAELLETIT